MATFRVISRSGGEAVIEVDGVERFTIDIAELKAFVRARWHDFQKFEIARRLIAANASTAAEVKAAIEAP